VCTPALLERHGHLPGLGQTGRYRLVHSTSEPWDIWLTGKDEGKEVWPASGTAFDDSVSVLHAAEQGQGLALARWSLAAAAIGAGTLVLAHPQALKFASSYWFVCPSRYVEVPKVAAFRQWLVGAARQAPKPAI
jgi:LysR family glycine cleavage system transcriptional activator